MNTVDIHMFVDTFQCHMFSIARQHDKFMSGGDGSYIGLSQVVCFRMLIVGNRMMFVMCTIAMISCNIVLAYMFEINGFMSNVERT